MVARLKEQFEVIKAEEETKKSELESNIATCDNLALLHRFKASLAQTQDELRQKEDDLEGLSMF